MGSCGRYKGVQNLIKNDQSQSFIFEIIFDFNKSLMKNIVVD